MATINPSQDYDLIQTLTFAAASGTCKISLYRGSSSATSGTVYYREGTSGSWTELSVSGTSTTFPVSSTTMQVGLDWNKSGNNYTTPAFYGQSTNLTEIAISQKAALSGTMGDYFMYLYASGYSSLTSLDVPDTSSLTSVGTYFMYAYAHGCSNLTSLAVPDTSSLTSAGYSFMVYYAYGCSNLTSLAVPDTSSLTSVGTYFMYAYAYGCSSLTRLELPAAGGFVSNNINWSVPSGRLGYLKGYVSNSTDLSDWQDLTAETKTLYINYIRDSDDVILEVEKTKYLDSRVLISQSKDKDIDAMVALTREKTKDIDSRVAITGEKTKDIDSLVDTGRNAEDFTTYTEVDSESEITVNKYNGTTVGGGTLGNSYIYKDFGAGAFSGDFEILFEVVNVDISLEQYVFVMMVSTTYGNAYNHGQNNILVALSEDFIFLSNGSQSGGFGAFGFDQTAGVIGTDTRYYCKLKRVGVDVTLEIRTGSHTGSLVDTLSIEQSEVSALRYVQTLHENSA